MKKAIFGIAAILAIGLIAAGAFAMNFHGRANDTAIQAAVAAGDYNAFTQALAANNVSRNVTQDQFNTIVQRYKTGSAMRAQKQKIDAALQSNDYNAWQTAMNGMIDLQKAQVTQENFNAMVKAYNARKNHNPGKPHGRPFHQ